MKTSPGNETSRSARKVRTIEEQQDFARVIAVTERKLQAAKAGRVMAIFRQSPAQRLMIFQQFQKPGKRNKILRDYGMDPIFLPGEKVPEEKASKGRSRV